MKTLIMLFTMAAAKVLSQTYEHKAVAAVLLGEAACQGKLGMLAVGEVIAQRARLDGKSALQVIRKHRAFSCLSGRSLSALIKSQENQPLFQEAVRIAKRVVDRPSTLPNVTNGATHFTHITAKPYWARGSKPVLIHRDHAFYRLAYP